MLAEAEAGDNGPGDVAVPPTIQALLAARLDQLDAAERSVLERGCVEGQVFHRGAVLALAPEEPRSTGRLMALVRKDLVRPVRSTVVEGGAFRFRHLLIRDAAYDALPKATRAEQHERFALWLEEHAPDLVELDEIVGYHLEQAYNYRAELGPLDDGALALGPQAAARLLTAGRRAQRRGDLPAAQGLLVRSSRTAAARCRSACCPDRPCDGPRSRRRLRPGRFRPGRCHGGRRRRYGRACALAPDSSGSRCSCRPIQR